MIANYWPHLLAIIVGAGLTLQVGMNATVARAIGTSVWASIANFAVGLAALIVLASLLGSRVTQGSVAQVPGWAWLGGLFGAAYVATATLLGPRLGAMTLVAFVLAGQLGSALLVDQYGVLGFPRNPVTVERLVGAALLLAGALLVMRR